MWMSLNSMDTNTFASVVIHQEWFILNLALANPSKKSLKKVWKKVDREQNFAYFYCIIIRDMKDTFNSKAEIVQALQAEFGENPKGFYNTPTNKSVEKFWTFNRTLQHLFKLRRDYVMVNGSKMLRSFYENVWIQD
jgi:hypothetical protein